MRIPLFTAALLLCSFLGNAQDIPKEFITRYYYQFSPKNAISVSDFTPKVAQWLEKSGYVYIDSHTWNLEVQNGYDTIANVTKKYTSSSFYVASTEVSNAEYALFLNSSGLSVHYPDTAIWPTNAIEEDPYVHYYFQHAGYGNYPVLGVNHYQATEYCKWKEIELNKQLHALGIKDLNLTVSLPTDAEWQNMYYTSFAKWYSMFQTVAYPTSSTPTYLNYIYGHDGYRCHFGQNLSIRLQNLKLPMGQENSSATRPLPVNQLGHMGGIYHLLGNASEWTSTSADSVLFNNQDYLYTMSDKIIPYAHMITDSTMYKKTLRDPKALKEHFLIKGGSWQDDIYYLQPAATRFENQWYHSNAVGFRYIIKSAPN